MHLSSINVINGLNLTVEQAEQLRAMAKQVEKAAQSSRKMRGEFSPEVGQIRDAYLEVRDYILHDKPVPESLVLRVGKARAQESALVRSSLVERKSSAKTSYRRGSSRQARSAPMRCTECHAVPSAETRRKAMKTQATGSLKVKRGKQKDADRAHMFAFLTQGGTMTVARLSGSVDRLLSDGQKSILESFSCCIVPPQELSDPVRAGQAESSERDMDFLRKVREVPASAWPTVREMTLSRVSKNMDMKKPGMTASQRNAARRRIASLLDRVRKMDDTEFELEKDNMAKQFKSDGTKRATPYPSFKAAMFLLLPGADDAYDQLIARLRAEGAGQ